jgi:Arc/MetJ family transcription regulator
LTGIALHDDFVAKKVLAASDHRLLCLVELSKNPTAAVIKQLMLFVNMLAVQKSQVKKKIGRAAHPFGGEDLNHKQKRVPHPFRVLCGRVGGEKAPENRYNHCIEVHTISCNNPHMATNLALDDNLIEEARRAGGHKTKKDAVTAALAEYVQHRKQLRILKAFGTVDFDPKYDYKAQRRRKRS